MSETSAPSTPSSSTQSNAGDTSVSPSANTSLSSSDSSQPSESTPSPRYKIKANGQEHEVSIEEALKLAELGKGASSKFEEAAKMRKQTEAFMRRLKEDPMSVLQDKNLGINFRELAEEYLYSQLQDEQMSPADKERRQMEEELKKFRSKEQEEKTRQQQEQELRAQQHYEQHYDRLISEGLSKSGLPKTANTVRSVAKYLNMALDAGYEATVDDVLPLVKQDYVNSIKELFGASDGDTLLSLLGDDVANKIRKSDLARLRGMQQQPKPQPVQQSQSDASKPRKQIDKYEATELIKKRLGI
jgi:GGDEF domain-containing protein